MCRRLVFTKYSQHYRILTEFPEQKYKKNYRSYVDIGIKLSGVTAGLIGCYFYGRYLIQFLYLEIILNYS